MNINDVPTGPMSAEQYRAVAPPPPAGVDSRKMILAVSVAIVLGILLVGCLGFILMRSDSSSTQQHTGMYDTRMYRKLQNGWDDLDRDTQDTLCTMAIDDPDLFTAMMVDSTDSPTEGLRMADTFKEFAKDNC